MICKIKFSGLYMFLLTVMIICISGCVNYDQKTIIKEDGSGSMKIHYWSEMKNFSMGTTLGKFEFDESKAKDKYSSSNTTVNSVKVEDKLDDSTKHVWIELDFKDISKLSDAKGFEGVKVTWSEVSDGMQLKYFVAKDTSAAGQMNAGQYSLTYEFTMPSEIVSTNGTKDDKTVKYSYKLSDLNKDIEMTITVKKSGGKICGLIGIIISMIVIGLAYSRRRSV